jgi:hypothetical protein
MAGHTWKSTVRLRKAVLTKLEARHPYAVRQMFYSLVSTVDEVTGRPFCSNDSKAQAKRDVSRVSRLLTQMREEGTIPWSWIVDSTRPVHRPSRGWASLAEYADYKRRSIKSPYQRDPWQMQKVEIVFWCEKETLIKTFEDITEDYGIAVWPGRGDQSSTHVHELAEEFKELGESGKEVYVFYLGDFDPKGMAIEKSWSTRVADHGGKFHIQRLAIFQRDIKQFKLPTMRIKPEDSTGPGFEKKWGVECVELDALPLEELRSRIQKAILGKIDTNLWEASSRLNKTENEIIRKKWTGKFPAGELRCR